MPIIRKFAIQGHSVPNGYQRALGPFPPEVLRQNPVVYNYEHSDSLHEALDDVRMFRCRECGGVVHEDERSVHDCEYEY